MSIELKPHNVETLKKVKEKYKESKKVAIVHPTGTGKSIIALKLIEESEGKKVIYVAPSNSILHNLKKDIFAFGMNMTHFPNLRRMTYQKLAKLSEKEIQELDADLIILDEFHHCGAEKWGNGVERLLQRNLEANILGLSATPIRYFDGLRDMSDELFDGNVASEMTLEEAIAKGILPKAKYVSALYGYDEELKNMLEKIEKIRDPEKREQAEELFNRMSKRLSEETKNLPQLLANNMTNKTGKYIVFCKNIDDMREKMAKAQEMFGQVNSNITVRSVSSDEDIKKNENMLTEFEKDDDEGSLKLLFAVNMLNEGYHIKELDGVVMMRPTYSPTIYAQQLGRALSVGNGKEPVIIDLVNNFDSCKIIEDFAERMKQYEKSGEKRKDNAKTKSRLSIFDKTQEFRNIAQKITDILSTTKVPLKDKIDIFEEFVTNNDEEITGTTMYEGFPIGQWAIQIRACLKRNDNTINPTDEQLERLENLGILESQIESTIDEKIESMAEWVKKYPKAKLLKLKNVEATLKEYSANDEEYEKLLEEYKKMQSYYDYARTRKSQGKLTDEQLETLKNANIGGVFGYSDEVEELSQKYGYGGNDVVYLLNKYGTIEDFYNQYLNQEIEDEFDCKLAIRPKVNNFVDVDGNQNHEAYEAFIEWIIGTTYNSKKYIYSSEMINERIKRLTPRERKVIERRFDLNGEGLPRELESLGREFKVTRERIRQIIAKAYRKLRYRIDSNPIIFELDNLKVLMTEEEKKEYDQLDDNISDVLLEIKTPQDEDVKRDFDFLKKVMEELKERKVIKTQTGEIPYEIRLEELDLSVKSYNCLRRAGFNTIAEIRNLTEEDLLKVRNMSKTNVAEILEKLKNYETIIQNTQEDIEPNPEQDSKENSVAKSEESKLKEMTIEELDLSKRAFTCLKRRGYNTLGALLEAHENDLLKIQNMGPKSIKEIMEKIEPYRKMIEAEKEEPKVKQEDKTQKDRDEDMMQEFSEESDVFEKFMQDDNFFEEINLMVDETIDYEKLEDEDPIESESLEEEKTEEKPKSETEQKLSDLQSAKAKRDELQEMINRLKAQMSQAQSLLDECNEVLGENKEDKNPNLED